MDAFLQDICLAAHRGKSAAETARSQGMSVSTLRRHLMERGTTYQRIKNKIRMERAKEFLLDGRTIKWTSYELGFSEVSAFHRAFKKWVGKTPTAFLRWEK